MYMDNNLIMCAYIRGYIISNNIIGYEELISKSLYNFSPLAKTPKNSISSAYNTKYPKLVNRYTITFPNVSTIETSSNDEME